MPADTQEKFQFGNLGTRRVECDFSGGHLSSDGGVLLLREVESHLKLGHRLARCFVDGRDQRFVEHQLEELLVQRLIGLSAGYEDLNDHNALRLDPLLAVAAGKVDPTGMDRKCAEDKGKALAGASTLNRLELGNEDGPARYRKISARAACIEQLLIEMGVETLAPDTEEVVLDFDATDDTIHGLQEGRFFQGYYRNYCYLPLYCFAGAVPLLAQLRSSDGDACKGTVEALEKIVPAIRRRCPNARIIVRADSGFCRENIMAWCEQNEVYYCIGLARNPRLIAALRPTMARARATACLTGGYAREFTAFEYRTLDSWTRSRHVIAKAEVLPKGDNPRFIVTNLPEEGFDAKKAFDPNTPKRFAPAACYEDFYCARGDMENRIKEQQLDLFGDRTSTHYMASNQLRLWFSTFAYFLLERMRTLALHGTELAKATAGTIRLKLVKIAAHLTVSCRRIHVRLASACPMREVFATAQRRLIALPTASA
jgi:hypothetical protein